MGICYYIACRDCKVKRDLDKLNVLSYTAQDREKALEIAKIIDERPHSLRIALLTSFLSEHRRHNCTVLVDTGRDDDILEGIDDEGREFWA